MEHNFQQLLYTTAEGNQNINAIFGYTGAVEYYGVVEPPVRRRRSHGSGRSEPAVLCRERLFI